MHEFNDNNNNNKKGKIALKFCVYVLDQRQTCVMLRRRCHCRSGVCVISCDDIR